MAKRSPRKGARKGATASAPRPKSRDVVAAPGPSWTFMLYLAGDNNLSDEMIWALKEIYRVGTPAGVNVTVQFDAADGPTRRYLALGGSPPFDEDGAFGLLHEEDVKGTETTDGKALVDFVVKSMRSYETDRYMLILSGHGAGIIGDFLVPETGQAPGGGSGPKTPELSASNLGELLEDIGRKLGKSPGEPVVDVLGLDSCLMSMGEVCSSVRDTVSYLVGSEGFVPNTGWPYFRLLQRLRERVDRGDPLYEPDALSDRLVDHYTLYYSDFLTAGVSVDLSACQLDTAKVDALEAAVHGFVEYYETNRKAPWLQSVIVLAHWRTQSYMWEAYVDLKDFCGQVVGATRELFEKDPDGDELVERCEAVIEAVEGLVRKNDFSGVAFQHSHGLSIYFPWSERFFDKEAYFATTFHEKTGWGRFLEDHFSQTQRKPRNRRSDPPVGRTLLNERIGEYDIGRMVSSAGLPFQGKVTAPASKVTAPASKVTAPASKVTAPASKFAAVLLEELDRRPGTMKNPPTKGPILVNREVAARLRKQTTSRQVKKRQVKKRGRT